VPATPPSAALPHRPFLWRSSSAAHLSCLMHFVWPHKQTHKNILFQRPGKTVKKLKCCLTTLPHDKWAQIQQKVLFPPPRTSILLPVLIVYDPLCGRRPVKEKGVFTPSERGQKVAAGERNIVAYLRPKCHRNDQKVSNKAKTRLICKLILIINCMHNLHWNFTQNRR